MKKHKEYEVFILNTSGIEYTLDNCSDPHIVIGGLTIPLIPENLPKLYEHDIEYMERFVFSIPEMPATEDADLIDWYENTLPTQVGRGVLWENGWYAEDSVSFIRPVETMKTTAQEVPDLEPNNYALCVHCGASHHMDDDHTCAEPDDPDLLMDPAEYAAKHDKGGE